MKHYTIGEIYRLGIIKNAQGEPYKHKASISKLLKKQPSEMKRTRWGMARTISAETLAKLGYATNILDV